MGNAGTDLAGTTSAERWRTKGCVWSDWRSQMRHSLRGVSGLRELLGLTREDGRTIGRVTARYPLRATPYYLSLGDPLDAGDPVLAQCVPDPRELTEAGGARDDPFGERARMPVDGLVHRFRDRVVLLVTSRCAVNCRHCTRKNLLSRLRVTPCRQAFEPMLRYVRAHSCVREVIVSGGDPLLLDIGLLDWLLGSLQRIVHVEVLRLGSRLPAVLPMRVDAQIAAMLGDHRPLWLNTQFNHVKEVTPDALQACDLVQSRGIPVSNQCVLLRGVNDSEQAMRELCNTLQRNMIRPYYVFECDRVRGTSHFWTPRGAGVRIAESLRTTVGGLALPKFVADVPGEQGKVQVRDFPRTGEGAGKDRAGR